MIMENSEHLGSTKQDSPEVVPRLIQYISSNEVAGFDRMERVNVSNDQNPIFNVTAVESVQIQIDESPITSHHRTQSISMPATPLMEHNQGAEHVLFSGNKDLVFSCGIENSSGAPESAGARQAKFYSQPMPAGFAHVQATNAKQHTVGTSRFKDKRFDSFRTWSKKFETQEENGPEERVVQNPEVPNLPVDRYFDALEGPELDTLRASEELVLPEDKQWPFLLRFPISSFGICLGVSSQAIMWKALATSLSTQFLHISLKGNLILWCISIALVALVSIVYCLKMILYFEAVRREYYHPVRVNFFFAPGIALLFLVLGVPPSLSDDIPKVLWYILMFPIFCLELKIYGQWMSGGQRRLSKVANPSNHLSIVGNFVGALLGASMGLKEGPIFFFAVGLAHYTVLFVTLYQRLPTNETLPKELHPVFFLFVAAPSVASMAWANIQGSFDYGSRIAYFIALFLYFSLAVRVNFFRGFRFSLAWWAYTFPMTGAAIATMKYANEVTNVVTQSLSAVLCAIATLTVTALLVTTIFHAFVLRDLFPNDIAIAISQRKPKSSKKWFQSRHGSYDTKDIEILMKSVTSAGEGKDIESGLSSQNHNESNDNDKNASCPTKDQSK